MDKQCHVISIHYMERDGIRDRCAKKSSQTEKSDIEVDEGIEREVVTGDRVG